MGEGIFRVRMRDDTEAPGIMIAQLFSCGERNCDVVVRAELGGGINDSQAARHSEVDDHVMIIVEVNDEVFRASGNTDDLAAFDICEGIRHRLAQITAANDDFLDRSMLDMRQNPQSSGLHFRQLRHGDTLERSRGCGNGEVGGVRN